VKQSHVILAALILVLLSAAAEARYMLDAKGRWVKCAPDDGGCQTVPPPSPIPAPTVGQPQPAPPPHERK
jgi:hypothetical protein